MGHLSIFGRFVFTIALSVTASGLMAKDRESKPIIDPENQPLLDMLPDAGPAIKAARKDAIKLCKKDDMDACERAGYYYRGGVGGVADPQKAYAVWKKACDATKPKSCLEYGRMASAGLGGAQDYPAAFAAFDFACKAELQKACTNTGVHYQFGRGVEKNVELARLIFTRSCAKEEVVGCHNRAVILLQLGGPMNDELARLELKENCDRKYQPSCDLSASLPPLN
ncbi:tetratricopeptide repeat protein [Sphingorhabdus arenilitoris]|uniref:Tetratricopeptide repeat protein n=1 Tax=Sphingorhabdus arenilitoris TaxID=1490041 RepID=A0ABV8RFZ1_9SPHN